MPHQVATTLSHQALNGAFNSTSNVDVCSTKFDWKRRFKIQWALNTMLILSLIAVLVLIILLLSHRSIGKPTDVCLTPTCIKEAARILNFIDASVSPCDDFYRFSCGQWIDNTAIPEHRSSISSFDDVQDVLNNKLRTIIETPSDNEPDFVGKAKTLYKSCMNLDKIEAKRDEPLRKLLSQLNNWPVLVSESWEETVKFNWMDTYAKLRELGLYDRMLISLYVYTDDKNTSRRIIYLDQLSPGLFDRDLLLKGMNDSSVSAYYKLMVKSAILLGAEPNAAVQQMQEVLDFEMSLANHSLPKEQQRNMTLIYNKMTIEELQRSAPNTKWLSLINNFLLEKVTESEEIVLIDPAYIRWVDLILPQTKPRTLANYILWRIVYSKTSYLNKEWRELNQEFDAVVYGKKRREPRWEECIDLLQSTMDIALSNLYVKKYFSNNNKQMMTQLIMNIKHQFSKLLNEIDWMKGLTLRNAKDKLDAIKPRIGYPEELIDDNKVSYYYRTLDIFEDDLFKNTLIINKWHSDYVFSKLREFNDKDDWRKYASVAEVNAYYYSQENSIVFPAGILQGIFFNKDRPNMKHDSAKYNSAKRAVISNLYKIIATFILSYLNYGAIGEVAGHEITHGFDDTGRQYGKDGHVQNWWDDETDEKFKKKAQCIVDQYANFSIPEIGLNLNGINTQGENIADNGGIKQAFRAYRDYVKEHGTELPLPGLTYTPEQLFWISFGLQSCSKESKENLKLQIEIDSHSPSKFRVIGSLSNSKEFAETFNCPIGKQMNPILKCNVW